MIKSGDAKLDLEKEALTDRQRRELKYYEQYSVEYSSQAPLDFELVQGNVTRPWNPYGFTYQHILENSATHASSGNGSATRLLDFGCGAGELAVLMASRGFRTWGIDISPSNVQLAQANAASHGLAERTEFVVTVGERLPFDNDFFDVVAGLDILHHVDIPLAMRECYRILKPGGFAIFREPVEARGFDWVRNWSIVQKLFPKSTSFDLHITDDERKLNRQDRQVLAEIFDDVTEYPFTVFSRFHKLMQNDKVQTALEKFDAGALKYLPLKPWAGCIVFKLSKAK